MLSVRACHAFFLLTALTATSAVASRTHRAPTSGHPHHKASVKAARHTAVRGQRGIDPDRAREIQTALIKQNYLAGEPSGQWDAQTETAMQKYQADHGWQTKLTPDSRALIRLGLGPNHSVEGTPASATATTSASTNPAPAADTLASTHIIQN
jgi:peptidoglycan hydrolase-like protein with peptidoglycan-binding domain